MQFYFDTLFKKTSKSWLSFFWMEYELIGWFRITNLLTIYLSLFLLVKFASQKKCICIVDTMNAEFLTNGNTLQTLPVTPIRCKSSDASANLLVRLVKWMFKWTKQNKNMHQTKSTKKSAERKEKKMVLEELLYRHSCTAKWFHVQHLFHR